MNIDLFTSGYGECGLLCTALFENIPAGLIYDAETADITVEFMESPPFHCNIPVQEELQENLLNTKIIHIGFFENEEITDAITVPLLLLNDPYGGEFSGHAAHIRPTKSVLAFETFMKRCAYAQALYRDNLGDESSVRSVLKDSDPKNLQFAAQLTRQRQLELQGPQLGPDMGPRGPAVTHSPVMGGFAPKGPGGTPSATPGTRYVPPFKSRKKPPTDKNE